VRVVLDVDVGIDDALAILYLAGRPEVEIVAVGSVHGNCRADTAAQNALRVLDVCGLTGVPVAEGAAAPLARPLELAPYVHGKDGLGDIAADPPQGTITGESAADQLVRLGREQPGELDLLAVAPLTNLALAVERDPEVLERFRSVVIMGGSGPFPKPGVYPETEWNLLHDPDAARIVYGARRQRMVMVGINATNPVVLDEPGVERLAAADSAAAGFATRILVHYLSFHERLWGRRACSLHDPAAAGVLVDQSFATAWQDGPVEVRSDGEVERAMLMRTADGGVPLSGPGDGPPTRAITAIDQPAFLADFLTRLGA
jgi:purine nucleosidase